MATRPCVSPESPRACVAGECAMIVPIVGSSRPTAATASSRPGDIACPPKAVRTVRATCGREKRVGPLDVFTCMRTCCPAGQGRASGSECPARGYCTGTLSTLSASPPRRSERALVLRLSAPHTAGALVRRTLRSGRSGATR